MIDWEEPLAVDGAPEYSVVILSKFKHHHQTLYLLEAKGFDYKFTILRDENNNHVSMGEDTIYGSNTTIINKPKLYFKYVYSDSSMDSEWWANKFQPTFDVVGVFTKENDTITFEAV